jgi:hypothetical protein
MTKDEKSRLTKQVMLILDELSDEYLIHKQPLIKKTDNIETGWGGNGKRKTTINFLFQTEKPTRKEIETRVKGLIDSMDGL